LSSKGSLQFQGNSGEFHAGNINVIKRGSRKKDQARRGAGACKCDMRQGKDRSGSAVRDDRKREVMVGTLLSYRNGARVIRSLRYLDVRRNFKCLN
jgi:hypothetical protein